MSKVQSYENHKKYVLGYHGIAFGLILFVLGWSIRDLAAARSVGAAAGVAAAVAIMFVYAYSRLFALQVQNRVIRLEEQLRMATLLPDDLKGRVGELRIPDYVALRFASDAELAGLVRRILSGELTTQDSIKRAIKEWRPDHVRA